MYTCTRAHSCVDILTSVMHVHVECARRARVRVTDQRAGERDGWMDGKRAQRLAHSKGAAKRSDANGAQTHRQLKYLDTRAFICMFIMRATVARAQPPSVVTATRTARAVSNRL